MRKQILVPIADGTEEIEAVTIIDTLRRASGEVTVASVNNHEVVCSRGVKILADCLLGQCTDKRYDLIALPGGMPGAKHLSESPALAALLRDQFESGRLYAAICAAPAIVLEPLGLLRGMQATCHPHYLGLLKSSVARDDRVVMDNQSITSRGPGTAIEFSLALVETLFGPERSQELAHAMVADVPMHSRG